jgi:hypothetical protein
MAALRGLPRCRSWRDELGATLRDVFHAELRQFPHVARAFNLTLEELRARIVSPWVAGQMVDWGDRRWAPERARLTIYEGPALRPDEIGMGRGWANATRHGEDVTARVLSQAQQPAAGDGSLKQEILALCAAGPIDVRDTVALVGDRHPEWLVSARIAVAEQAIWELLHAGSATLRTDGRTVSDEQWQPSLLAWGTWSGQGSPVLLEATQRQ